MSLVIIGGAAPEYGAEALKPIAYDLDLANFYMAKAGYQS